MTNLKFFITGNNFAQILEYWAKTHQKTFNDGIRIRIGNDGILKPFRHSIYQLVRVIVINRKQVFKSILLQWRCFKIGRTLISNVSFLFFKLFSLICKQIKRKHWISFLFFRFNLSWWFVIIYCDNNQV